jgi:hypothetical protein
MSAVFNLQDVGAQECLELRALEKMIDALCRHIEVLTSEERARGGLRSREAEFQLQAFAERRALALQTLQAHSSERREIRIERLERLIEALNCSRDYFRAVQAP